MPVHKLFIKKSFFSQKKPLFHNSPGYITLEALNMETIDELAKQGTMK